MTKIAKLYICTVVLFTLLKATSVGAMQDLPKAYESDSDGQYGLNKQSDLGKVTTPPISICALIVSRENLTSNTEHRIKSLKRKFAKFVNQDDIDQSVRQKLKFGPSTANSSTTNKLSKK